MGYRAALLASVIILAAGCSTAPRVPAPDSQQGGAALVRVAVQFIGTPYRFGAAGPDAFDCSGLVFYSHKRIGVSVPRTAAAQHRAAQPVDTDDLKPGDLLFFRIDSRDVDHVAIYAGGGRFIHAPSTGRVVSYAYLDDPYYRKRLVGAGRFWPDRLEGNIAGARR